MKGTNVYLTFDGNAEKAMRFYAKCLNAELHLMHFKDMPQQPGCEAPKGAENRVGHACVLLKGVPLIMASDSMSGMPFQAGNNFSINLMCESLEEIERLYKAFSENGTQTMPLEQTFWAERFGMLVDQFGVSWIFNYEKEKKFALPRVS